MDNTLFKKIVASTVFLILLVLSFFILKPILMAIVLGIILAFAFVPLQKKLSFKINSKNLSASIISICLLLILILPIWFFTPILIDQSVKFYVASQQINFIEPLKNLFPSLFASEEFSRQIGVILQSSVSKATNYLLNSFSNFILNFPTIFLQLLVVFFTFFFVLRDHEEFIFYIKSLLPFSKNIQKKLFDSSKGITISVIYGQIIIGIIQGLITSLGFFIFGVPNALLLSALAILAGIFPIIGTTVVWVPVVIYLLIAGNTLPSIGVTIIGLIASGVDNIIRPLIVSRRTKLPSSLVLIGMIGGIFMFGIMGIILGPLIFAYLLIIIDIYRNKEMPSILLKK